MRIRLLSPRILGPALAGLLAGCGQTGPLYLPDAAVTTPVEVRPAPATAPPAPAEVAAPAEGPDKDEKPTQPRPAAGD